MLLIIEQTNQLLLKNHDLKPTSAKAILKQMSMKIETSTDLEVVDEDQDMILKRVVVTCT